MRGMTHDNINLFLGACVDPPHICVLGQYCSKGTLQVRRVVCFGSEFTS